MPDLHEKTFKRKGRSFFGLSGFFGDKSKRLFVESPIYTEGALSKLLYLMIDESGYYKEYEKYAFNINDLVQRYIDFEKSNELIKKFIVNETSPCPEIETPKPETASKETGKETEPNNGYESEESGNNEENEENKYLTIDNNDPHHGKLAPPLLTPKQKEVLEELGASDEKRKKVLRYIIEFMADNETEGLDKRATAQMIYELIAALQLSKLQGGETTTDLSPKPDTSDLINKLKEASNNANFKQGVIDELEARLTALSKLLEEAQSGKINIEELQKQLDKALATIKELEAKLKTLEQESSNILTPFRNNSKNNELQRLTDELGEKKQMDILRSELRSEKEQNAALANDGKLQAEVNELRTKLAELQATLQSERKKCKGIEADLEQLSEQHENTARLTIENERLEAENKGLRNDNGKLKDENEGLNADIATLREGIKQLEALFNKRDAQIEELKSALRECEEQKVQLEKGCDGGGGAPPAKGKGKVFENLKDKALQKICRYLTKISTGSPPREDGCKEILNEKDYIYVKIGNGRYYKARIEHFCEKKIDDKCGKIESIGINTFTGNIRVSDVSLLPSIIFRARDGEIDIEEMNRLLKADGDTGWKKYLNADGRVLSGKLQSFHERYNIISGSSTTPLKFNVNDVNKVPSYSLKENWLKDIGLEDK